MKNQFWFMGAMRAYCGVIVGAPWAACSFFLALFFSQFVGLNGVEIHLQNTWHSVQLCISHYVLHQLGIQWGVPCNCGCISFGWQSVFCTS